MAAHPIRLVITDDLRRSRLTVFFRLLLAIPHYIWAFLWSIAAVVAVVVNWFATLIAGRAPGGLHRFLSAYIRYLTHVYAYVLLIANPYPGFTGDPGSYPIDIEIDPPAPQRRWKTALRLILALPALILSAALSGGGPGGGGGRGGNSNGGVLFTIAFLGWFACLARGRMPHGFRNLGAYSLGYSAQAFAYLFLLTDRYPNSDPGTFIAEPPLQRPIRLTIGDDLKRSRLTVFFRLLLAIPHFVWLFLWGIAALLAAIANWLTTLFAGSSPRGLHDFLAAYLRYQTHVWAYVFLLANPFPGFGTEPYPIELEIDPPAGQNRWVTAFRLLLAVPALLVTGSLNSALTLVAVFGWFVSLVLGRMPEGLRNLGAFALRYASQVTGYLFVLTDEYPFSGPPAESVSRGRPSPPPPAAEPTPPRLYP